jgi:hypothetical protein
VVAFLKGKLALDRGEELTIGLPDLFGEALGELVDEIVERSRAEGREPDENGRQHSAARGDRRSNSGG